MAGERPLGSVKTFACPNCGGKVEIHAPGQTLSAVCQYCQTSIDITDENFRILKTYQEKLTFKPLIPIGTRGELEGIPWEVIGFMVRRSLDYAVNWEEYLLFNPIHGFRWLIQDSGHWTLYRSTTEKPRMNFLGGSLNLGKQTFTYFSMGQVRVLFALGEFYWRVERGEEVKVQDYIDPPYVLSIEKEETGMHWALGKYIRPGEIRKAFGEEVRLPEVFGIGMNQPNPHRERFRQLLPIAIFLVVLLWVVKISIALTSPRHDTVFLKTYNLSSADSTFAAEEVSIPGRIGNVEVRLTSDVDNNWLEIGGILSKAGEAKTFNFNTGTEFYRGVSYDGESWSEGSRKESVLINLVPQGDYTLLLTGYTDGQKARERKPVTFTVQVVRNVSISSNIFMTMLLILLYPAIEFFFSRQFERMREES